MKRIDVPWISVKDRLPEHGTWAMWCSKDGQVQISRIKTEDAFIHFFPTAGESFFTFDEAVAWCPLPKPSGFTETRDMFDIPW